MNHQSLLCYRQDVFHPERCGWVFAARQGAVTLAVLIFACGETPSGAEISETEVWRLELEQIDDGSTSAYPRRGTITMRLRLNRTTQPDPTGNGHESGENVTTFVADVEAFPSRLQDRTTGSAQGSWNCHGFAATVGLNDGTRYELQSDGDGGHRLRRRGFVRLDRTDVHIHSRRHEWGVTMRGYFHGGRARWLNDRGSHQRQACFDILTDPVRPMEHGVRYATSIHGSVGLCHRARQEDQGNAQVSDEHGPQLP